MLFSTLRDSAFWTSVADEPRYAVVMQKVWELWELRYDEIPVLSYADRVLFYDTGDRKTFETPYFRRRNTMSAGALLAMIYPDEEKYLDYVQRMLWAICDEYSWALPAHTGGDPARDVFEIDLFNAETALAVSEICYVLAGRLDERVRRRAAIEVERRVLSTYRARVSWYETLNSNWAAVCGGCVGGAMMYLAPDDFRVLLPRFLNTMQRFIDGFSDDGICMEGTTYWNYGFSNFVWFADMLRDFTNGKTDLLQGEKIEKIARYMQCSFLKGNTTVSFSDGTRRGQVFDALQYYLSRVFPDSVHMLPSEVSTLWSGNVSWQPLSRAFLYAPPLDVPRALPVHNYDFSTAQQVIVNERKYSLFVKAGHNAEEHNHNDVGSFIISTDAGQVFCDLGAGLYTRQYFRMTMHERYAILCNSSLGHSVPVIDGQGQMMGRSFGGRMIHDDHRIRIEMAGAYDLPHLTRLTRTLEHGSDGVTLTDSFAGAIGVFVDRFVTLFEPTVYASTVRVANVALHFEPERVSLAIRTDVHVNHQGERETVWLLDFTFGTGITEARFTFEIL